MTSLSPASATTLYGDGGNDRLDGGDGVDMLLGGDGDDIITDLGGDDVIQGGEGNDAIQGGNGINLVIGGFGQDFINSGEDASEVFGGPGNDFILGSRANEQDMGNEGDDWIEHGNADGVPGDKVAVNGKIEPVLRVARRKYRLRLLNGGPSRFYEFYLVNSGGTTSYTFTYIANDGNLLPAPLVNQFKVRLGVAERADIVVDFAMFPLGTQLYLVNRLEQPDTRGPTKVQAPGTRVLKIIVDRNPPEPDVSRVLRILRPLRQPTAAEIAAAPVRRWVFERRNGMWAVNGQFFDAVLPPRRNAPRQRRDLGARES